MNADPRCATVQAGVENSEAASFPEGRLNSLQFEGLSHCELFFDAAETCRWGVQWETFAG